MKNRLTIKKGFTLTELLVVVAILGIISGISVLTYKSYRNSSNLGLTAEECKTLLTEALDLSLSPAHLDVKAYGILFDWPNKKMVLFADKDGNKFFSSVIDYKIKEQKLKNNVSYHKAYDGDPAAITSSFVVDFFLPSSTQDFPYSKVTSFHNKTHTTGKIIFKQGSLYKTVELNTLSNLITLY